MTANTNSRRRLRYWPESLVITIGAVVAFLSVAAGTNAPERVTHYGDAVRLGNGTARAYVITEGKEAVELGVALSETALDNLPMNVHDPVSHHDAVEYVLPVPAAARTPFTFVGLNWNPAGHEPPGIYDLPHFDFHFYTIKLEARNRIDPALDAMYEERAARMPAREALPEGYQVGPTVPLMGTHWFDPRSPELASGATFTQTLIWGSWDGKTIFVEPMITRDFLRLRPNFNAALPLPIKGTDGSFPTRYVIRWDDKDSVYRVALTDWIR